MNDIRVALVGCGRIAGHHCRSVSQVEGVSLAAVCDLETEKAKAYGTEFRVPYYSNYREMFDDLPEIDLVAIITPSGMHYEHATDIMENYETHIVVEKPTFMRPDQLEGAYQLAHELGLKIFPVFQNRYNKAVKRVKSAIDAGELGELRLVSVRVRWCRPQRYYDLAPWRGTFAMDGGAISNQGIHHVDLLRFLGGEVDRVNAMMQTFGAEIEVEDSVIANLVWQSGCIGNVEVTTAARPDDFEASISLVGSRGLAQIGGIAVNELQIFTPDPDVCTESSEDFAGIEGHGAVYGFGHEALYKDIVADFRGCTPYPVTKTDAYQTLKLLDSFYRSDEAGTWVNTGDADYSYRLGRSDESLAELYRTPPTLDR